MSGWVSMLVRRSAVLCALVALCAGALGCKTPYERAYGRSYSEHKARTIANPEAGRDDLEASRPDGASTDSAVYKHRTREAEVTPEEEPSVINIDIGGGS